jgi:hypothetical protein
MIASTMTPAPTPIPTFNIPSGMTRGIREAFSYRKRHRQGACLGCPAFVGMDVSINMVSAGEKARA